MCYIFWFYVLDCLNEIVPISHFEMLRLEQQIIANGKTEIMFNS